MQENICIYFEYHCFYNKKAVFHMSVLIIFIAKLIYTYIHQRSLIFVLYLKDIKYIFHFDISKISYVC